MEKSPFAIALVSPRIPANVGNIARLCAATQSPLHLVRPFSFFTDDKSLKRAGLDYWDYVTRIEHDSLAAFEKSLAGKRFFLISKFGTKNYTEVLFQKGDCLIFGSEEDGLPKDFLERHRDKSLRIPMFHPQVRCLNLANSVAIVLYEAIRQTSPAPHKPSSPDCGDRLHR